MLLRRTNHWALLGLAGGMLLLVVMWFAHRQVEPRQRTQISAGTSQTATKPTGPLPLVRSVNASVPGLQNCYDSLKSAPGAKTAKQLLTELRAKLSAMPKDGAVLAIRQFLDSKEDVPTGQGLKIGPHGFLTEAPTLRTWLLDYLGQIDPAAAADYSKDILASMDSPDEWAVALRNLARGDATADGRALLEQKTAQMLQYQPWQQNPSLGYLEAFDVAVYLGGTSLLPTLTDLVQQQANSAVAYASYLALDRLVIAAPTTTLTALLADPASMQGRQATRADYFARADVRDPQQLQLVENYLLNPQISASEINTFANIFPNANYMISPNLLTQTATPAGNTLASIDSASLQAVQQWLSDPRFASLRPSLESTEARLQQYVLQENK